MYVSSVSSTDKVSPVDSSLPDYLPFRAWWTVAVLMTFQTLSLIDRNILSLLIIEIRTDLGLSDFQVSLLQGLAFSGFYCLAGLFVGGLVDRHRAKPILYLCVTFWSLAATAVGVVRNYWGMMFARMMTGVGEGGVNPTGQVLIVSLFPKNRVSLPMGIFFASGSIGIGLSYFGGGLLLEAITAKSLPGLEAFAPWRQVLIATALPGLLIAFLAFTVRDSRSLRAGSTVASKTWREFGRFLASERKLFVRLALGYGLLTIVTVAVLSWAPTYGRRVLGMTPSEIGVRMGLISTVGGILAAAAYGQIVDWNFARGKIDFVQRAFVIGTLVTVPVCVVGFTLDQHAAFIAGLIAVQFILGASFGPGVAAIHMVTPPEMRGRMAALMVIVINFAGYAIGPMLVGALTDFVFADPNKVGLSIALTAIVLGPIAAALVWSARPHFVTRVGGSTSVAH